MAEPQSTTAIAPTQAPSIQPVREAFGTEVMPPTPDGGYTITIKRFNAAGTAQPLVVHLPADAKLATIRDNPLLLAAVLKDGDPVWSQYEPGFVLVAVLKAAQDGLDILSGDIYPVEGRLGTSDWAKIKYGRARGYRAEVEYKQGPAITIPWETKREKGVWNGTNDECICRIYDRNDKLVNTYATTLKAWFQGHSKEWKERTAESLRRKCLARAYQEVCPIGVDPEEAPPLPLIVTAASQSMAESSQAQTAVGAGESNRGIRWDILRCIT